MSKVGVNWREYQAEAFKKDPELKAEYDALEGEYACMKALCDLRKELNLTQMELSARTGVDQATISKIETGERNPSIKLLEKIAHGLGMNLSIRFVPKTQ